MINYDVRSLRVGPFKELLYWPDPVMIPAIIPDINDGYLDFSNADQSGLIVLLFEDF